MSASEEMHLWLHLNPCSTGAIAQGTTPSKNVETRGPLPWKMKVRVQVTGCQGGKRCVCQNAAAGNGVCILPNRSNGQILCHESFSCFHY